MKINTPIFNDQQKRFALILLSLFHIFIITASNYFVQIPFEINLKLTALDCFLAKVRLNFGLKHPVPTQNIVLCIE